jgi:hypothetical protein
MLATTTEALTCVSMMAKAIGPPLVGYMHDLLDPMFSAGLTRTLIDALTEVLYFFVGIRLRVSV